MSDNNFFPEMYLVRFAGKTTEKLLFVNYFIHRLGKTRKGKPTS